MAIYIILVLGIIINLYSIIMVHKIFIFLFIKIILHTTKMLPKHLKRCEPKKEYIFSPYIYIFMKD